MAILSEKDVRQNSWINWSMHIVMHNVPKSQSRSIKLINKNIEVLIIPVKMKLTSMVKNKPKHLFSSTTALLTKRCCSFQIFRCRSWVSNPPTFVGYLTPINWCSIRTRIEFRWKTTRRTKIQNKLKAVSGMTFKKKVEPSSIFRVNLLFFKWISSYIKRELMTIPCNFF